MMRESRGRRAGEEEAEVAGREPREAAGRAQLVRVRFMTALIAPRRALPLFVGLLFLLLSFPPSFAFETQLLEQSEQGLRVRVTTEDLRANLLDMEAGPRCRPASAGALLFQEGGRTWLSASLTVAVPPGTIPSLRVLDRQLVAEGWPAPVALGGDSLATGGPEAPGLRLLDLGWQRSQKLQRLALDLAVFQGGWQRLRSLDFELAFLPDKEERDQLTASRPATPWRESPVFERQLERQVLNPGQAAAWRADPRPLGGSGTPLQSVSPVFQDDWITRIMVDEDGLVRVDEADLRAAGVDTDAIDPATLSLWEGESELPLLMHDGADGSFDNGDYFVFAGRRRRGEHFPLSFFGPQNAYFLTWGHGTGRRFVDRSADPQDGQPDQRSYRLVEHYEVNRKWTSLELVDLDPVHSDHWQWREFNAIDTPGNYSLNISVEDPLGGSADALDHIRFAIRGTRETYTFVPAGADHHAVVRMEGNWVGDLESRYQDEAISNWFPLPPGLLADRSTVSLEFELPLDRGVDSDQIYLNWLDLDYLRALNIRHDGQLIAPAAQCADRNVQVWGLRESSPLVLSEDGWRLLGGRPAEGATGSLRVWTGGLGADLFISDLANLKAPARIVRHANGRLRDAANQADMLIVAPAQYLPALEELAQYHRQSMTVKLVDIEDVYSEFGQGLMSTQALQDMLLTSFHDWQTPAPTYLTLVGKVSRANQLKLGYEPRYRTQVPTWWVQTGTSGATASDENFTYLVGADTLWTNAQHFEFVRHRDSRHTIPVVTPDTFQDLLVGRISVYSVGQLQAYLAKHREYRERAFPGAWQETQVMCADLDSSPGAAFEVGNELIEQDIIPPEYPVADIHVRGSSPYHGGALDFIDLFNAGCSIMNYNGHGAQGILSSSSLFRSTDIRFLNNRGKYPISFAWSCLVGYFDDPDSSSMAELLLRKANAGSIAFYGSSAKATIGIDNPLMTQYFFHQYNPDPLSMGQIVQLTENALLLTPNTAPIIHMYNLEGDPALVPAFPRQHLRPDVPLLTLTSGETAAFSLATEPPGLAGSLEITFLPYANKPANFQGADRRVWTQAFSDGQSLELALPVISGPRMGRLLFAMTTATGRAVGQLPVFLNLPYAGLGDHSPHSGVAGNPLRFDFQSPLAVDSVFVMTNLVVDSLARMRMDAMGGGAYSRQIANLPAVSSNSYQRLGWGWLPDMHISQANWPTFQLNGLIYRFRIYDGEPYTDTNNNRRWDSGEPYTDENVNGQWDPPGEPFNDLNSSGAWEAGEPYQDLNESGAREGWIDLAGAFVNVLEHETITTQDTLITVQSGASGLEAALRWTISVSQPLDSVSVRLARQLPDSSWSALWAGREPAQSGPQQLNRGVDLAPGPQRLRFSAGPAWLGDAPLTGVDSLVLADAFTLLTPAAGSGGPLPLGGSGRWSLELPAGALHDAVQMVPAESGTPPWRAAGGGQPGLGLLQPLPADSLLGALELGPRAWAARTPADLAPAGGSLSCSFARGARFLFPDGALGDSLPLALARWIPARGLWVAQPGTQDTLDAATWRLRGGLTLKDGPLWPVALRDHEGPQLAAQVSGQWFADGDVVAREPVFQFQVHDPDGIDLGEGLSAPQLSLDGTAIPAGEIQLGEGATGLVVQWSPGTLEPGSTHQVLLRAWDALGNARELGTTFTVATDLALDFFSNHPNPFQGETTFAWQLSSLPRNLRFEIYTASGRLVRRIHIPAPRIGYDEYTWDGRDQQGRELANGAYFLRVVAGGDGEINEVFKLARLR